MEYVTTTAPHGDAARAEARGSLDDSHPDAPPLAVILAAGEGSRLARQGDGTPKPALRLLGLSLAERTITSCMAAGIQRFLVVLGHAAEQVQAHYQGIAARRQCDVEFVTAQDWKLGNGASALAAKSCRASLSPLAAFGCSIQ